MKSRLLLISTILATSAGISGTALASESTAPLGDHPAVIVARTSSTHGIDPNTFVVGHPAGSRLLASAPSDTAVATAAAKVSRPLRSAASGQ